MGCVCLTFDLRGHAATREQQLQVTREDNLRDVVAAYDLPGRASVAGFGVGRGGGQQLWRLSGRAAQQPAPRAVAGLARARPVSAMTNGCYPKNQLNRETLRAYRNTYVPPESNRALKACADFSGDVLIVEAEHDTLHSPLHHHELPLVRSAGSHSLTHRIIDGAGPRADGKPRSAPIPRSWSTG